MEKAISYLNVLPSTESEISNFVEKVLLESDEENPFNLKAQLVAIKRMVDSIEDGIQERLIRESDKYPEKKFSINGVSFERKSKTTYDYKHSAHYNKLLLRVKNWEGLMKLATTPIADVESGELIEPAHTKTTEYLAITLKK